VSFVCRLGTGWGRLVAAENLGDAVADAVAVAESEVVGADAVLVVVLDLALDGEPGWR